MPTQKKSESTINYRRIRALTRKGTFLLLKYFFFQPGISILISLNLKLVSFRSSRILGTFEFRQPALVVRDPETIKQVFVKDFDHFEDHRTVIDDKVR